MSEDQGQNQSDKATIGLSILSKVFYRDPEACGLVLGGFFDEEIKAAGDFVNDDGSRTLEGAKKFIRLLFNQAFAQELREQEENKKAAFVKTLTELRDSNKPHPCGSIKQLAEKLGVSISEVRRMKSAGTLDAELIARGIFQ